MNLVLDKKILKDLKKPLLTKEDWEKHSINIDELKKLQRAYLSTFDHEQEPKKTEIEQQ